VFDCTNVGQNGAASAWAGAGRYAYQINDTVVGYFSAKTRAEFTCNYYYNGSLDKYIQNGYAGLYLIDSTTGNHTWYTAPNNTSGANATMTNTSAMTLDASNNLSLGTTSVFFGTTNRTVLTINGTSSSLLSFGVGNAAKAYMYSDGTDLFIQNNIAGRTYVTTNSAGVYLATAGTSWTSNSDERLKTNLQPIEDAAQKVSTLRAVTGRFKTDDEGVSRAFLIAQDVQAVLPQAVDASDPEKLGVQYTDVIPLLVAAIQEQQTLITQLTARITALESA
jgi:hypothetical protein